MDSSDVDTYMSMDTNKFEGLTALKSSSTPATPICPTGNCTYTRFHSLGMCSRVANITSLVNVTMVPEATPDSWLLWYDKDYPNITTYNVSLPLPRTWFLSPVKKSIGVISAQLFASICRRPGSRCYSSFSTWPFSTSMIRTSHIPRLSTHHRQDTKRWKSCSTSASWI